MAVATTALAVALSACGAASPGTLSVTMIHLVSGSGPTGWRTLGGVVSVQPSGGKALVVDVNAAGRFGMTLSPGRYTVTACSPASCAGTSVQATVKSASITAVALRCPH